MNQAPRHAAATDCKAGLEDGPRRTPNRQYKHTPELAVPKQELHIYLIACKTQSSSGICEHKLVLVLLVFFFFVLKDVIIL